MANERAKKIIGGIYSFTADKLYEPVVVKGAFPLFGGDLNALAEEQGRAAVSHAKGRPILDIPVGTAFFTVKIAEAHDGIVIGSDIARGMVQETHRVAGEAGVGNLAPLQADIHSLPLKTSSIKAVVCTNGLQVIPGLRPSLAELVRVLEPNGMLFCSVLTLPLSKVLPRTKREHLPTLLRSGMEVADEISAAGLYVSSIRTERFATLIEAIKPE